jgi:hypothetical protein
MSVGWAGIFMAVVSSYTKYIYLVHFRKKNLGGRKK